MPCEVAENRISQIPATPAPSPKRTLGVLHVHLKTLRELKTHIAPHQRREGSNRSPSKRKRTSSSSDTGSARSEETLLSNPGRHQQANWCAKAASNPSSSRHSGSTSTSQLAGAASTFATGVAETRVDWVTHDGFLRELREKIYSYALPTKADFHLQCPQMFGRLKSYLVYRDVVLQRCERQREWDGSSYHWPNCAAADARDSDPELLEESDSHRL